MICLKEFYSVGEAAKMLNVHRTTLQRWDREGKLIPYRLPSGRRRYSHQQLLNALDGYNSKSCFVYLSCLKSENYSIILDKVEKFKLYSQSKNYQLKRVFLECIENEHSVKIELKKLLKDVVAEKPDKLIIENRTLFIEEGYDYIKELLSHIGTDIEEVRLDESTKTRQKVVFLSADEREMSE